MTMTGGSDGESRRLVRAAGITGVIAAALSAWADLALQYTADPSHLMSRQYLFLLDRSPADLLLGHNLGVFAILLQIAGLWAVGQGLVPAGRGVARIWFLLAASALAVGAAFHATFAPIGLALHGARLAAIGATAEIAEEVRPAQAVLGTVTLLGISAAALLFSGVVLLRRTGFPRWMAAVTPLTLSIALAIASRLASRLAPFLRLLVIPAGINCAETVFFLLATILLWNRPQSSPMSSFHSSG